MTPWSAWLPELTPHVPGCPAVLARAEVRRAAQALLKDSRVWKADLPAMPVAAGQGSVTILVSAPAEQMLVRIENAWLDGQRLDRTSPEELDASCADDWRLHTGAPSHYFALTPGVVSLYPVPITAALTGLTVRASLMPSDTATGLPDDIARFYMDDIQMGARARLMAYAGKSWSNPQMAAVYAGAFDTAASRSSSEAARSNIGSRIASRPKWC